MKKETKNHPHLKKDLFKVLIITSVLIAVMVGLLIFDNQTNILSFWSVKLMDFLIR